jgi:hypothetical protein
LVAFAFPHAGHDAPFATAANHLENTRGVSFDEVRAATLLALQSRIKK